MNTSKGAERISISAISFEAKPSLLWNGAW